MKIGIYNPYFDSIGGGERYVLTAAAHWSVHHEVDIFWDHAADIRQASVQFDLDLTRTHIVPNIFRHGGFIRKLWRSMFYDCILIVSDGSIPTSLARHNIVHFQVPFAKVYCPAWKKIMYEQVVVNSEFTKSFLDPSLSIKRSVVYPPVARPLSGSTKKSTTILTVGRFGGLYNTKKHDVLLGAFKELLTREGTHAWRLVIAGSLLSSDKSSLDLLQKKAQGLPVEFKPNCSFDQLQKLYRESSIYWHASGFGETKPEHMEHFGISTVEAMSYGAVPIVFRGGGQTEIVEDSKNGFLWSTVSDLVNRTVTVIHNRNTLDLLSNAAKDKSKQFSQKRFTDAFDEVLDHFT